jgi:NitT/TauT family transport system ATP-binding protein
MAAFDDNSGRGLTMASSNGSGRSDPSGKVIEVDSVSRSFERADGQRVNAVDTMSADVLDGEFVCVVGPSGCGKTTLLQMIAGLLMPTEGEIRVAGSRVTGPGPDRGVVFQKDSVFPWMRVLHNVEYGLKCRGVPTDRRREIAHRFLAMVGLSAVEKAWPRELSGGMLKRVAVATVFANGAHVLLLDEPFAALDYVTKHQLHDVLLELWMAADVGSRRTVVFVTHDVEEALSLSDRILVMNAGRLVDDIAVQAPRPRTTDTLLEPEMVEIKHVLLGHLGLEQSRTGARG